MQVADYLFAREEEGLGPSVPIAVASALGWFEKVAGQPTGSRLVDNPFVQIVVQDLTRKLQERSPPVRRAPRMPSAFLSALEAVVVSESQPASVRVAAWVKLVKVWASLRFDDMANMTTGEVRFNDGQMSGVLRKTKTSSSLSMCRQRPTSMRGTGSRRAWACSSPWDQRAASWWCARAWT